MQCDARAAQCADLDELTKSSGTVIKQGIYPDDCTVPSLVHEVESKIARVRDQVTARTDEIRQLDGQWSRFEDERGGLAQRMKATKNAAESLRPAQNDIEGIQRLMPSIDELLEQTKQLETDKVSLHKAGKHLTQLSPASLGSVQNTLASADAEWDDLFRLLTAKKAQCNDVAALWRECSDARHPLYAVISDARQVSEDLEDRLPNDLAQATEMGDQCRRSIEQLRKARSPLDALVVKSGQLHAKLDQIQGFDTRPLREEMDEIQRDWNDTQSALTAQLQSLDMQQVVFRQLAALKDDLLNWTSDSKEALAEALSTPSADMDLMELKLNKVKQEMPTYRNVRDNLTAKIRQLTELAGTHGKRPTSLGPLEELIDAEMKETQGLCDRLEESIASISQQEDELRKGLKTLAGQIADKKDRLKMCEDLTGTDDQLAQRYLLCQQAAAEYPAIQEALAALKERCKKLQDQRGSSDETSVLPLAKEMRSAQKQADSLAAQMKRIGDNLRDAVQKRYTERMAAIQRATSSCREKLDWCSSEPSADRFSVETKLDALDAVDSALNETETKLADLKSAAAATAAILPGSQKEVDALVKSTEENLRILREDCSDKRQSADFSNDLLRRFETTSETASAWLRDVESTLRNETVSQTGLAQLADKIQFIQELHADIENHRAVVDEVKEIADQIMAVMPESHVAHFSSHLAMRYGTAIKFVQSFLTKQETLKSGYESYQETLQRMESWLQSSDDQLRVHEKDVTTVPGSKPSLAYQSKLQALKVFMGQKDEGQLLLNQTVQAGDALVPNITSEDKTAIRTALRNLRDRWESHLDQVNNLYKKVEGIILQLSSFDDSCRQIRRWIEETRLRLIESALDDQTGRKRTVQDVKEELQTLRILAQDVQSHQSLVSRLRERLQEISNPDAAATVDAIVAAYQKLAADSQDRVSLLEKRAADYDAYACSIETFRDWLSGLKADLMLTDEGVTDKASAETKLRVISELLEQSAEGETLLSRCQECIDHIVESSGHQVSRDEYEAQRADWQAFLAECNQRNERLAASCSRWNTFEDTTQSLMAWLRQAEAKVQDQALKATVAAKEAHLEKLMAAQSEIAEKEAEFSAIVQMGQQMDGEPSLQAQVPQMAARYQALVGNVRDMIGRYQGYAKEHQDFNSKHAEFLTKVDELTKRLDSCREIVGDYKILLERRNELERLQERRAEMDKASDALADLGEKLYVHTGPDGREKLRVQLKIMRERWEFLCDDLNSTSAKLDQCLQQCAEFSASQEQLTRWLKDVEQSMLQHSDLK